MCHSTGTHSRSLFTSTVKFKPSKAAENEMRAQDVTIFSVLENSPMILVTLISLSALLLAGFALRVVLATIVAKKK